MKKIKPNEGNEYFCVVPWLHTHVSAQSERRLCCMSIEKPTRYARPIDDLKDNIYENRPDSLKDYWNSEYMMNIRKRLMSGERISQCEMCNNNVVSKTTLKKHYSENLFIDKIDDIFTNTDNNGYTSILPISYHYIINNSCNFKCRTCGDQASSSWKNENFKRDIYKNNKPEWLNHKDYINSFQKEFVENELWEAVNNKTIEEINWSGGEPLIWPMHWEVMNALIENGHAKNVTIRYNTNLSKITYKNKYIYDILKNFKNVNLACSMDGTGEIAEYIRHGLKWEKWLQNFKDCIHLNNYFDEWTTFMDLTVTLPGLFSVKKMIDLALELNVNTTIKSIYNLDSQIIFNPLMIPKNILHEILDDIIIYAKEKSKINKKIEKYVESFEDLKNKKTFEETDIDWLKKIKIGKDSIIDLDKHRNNIGVLDNIFSKNQKLSEWWEKI